MTDPASPDALELSELDRLFELGDYRALRDRAAVLRRRALEQEDKGALDYIDQLLSRLKPDPTGGLIYLLAFLVLGTMTWLTYSGALG